MNSLFARAFETTEPATVSDADRLIGNAVRVSRQDDSISNRSRRHGPGFKDDQQRKAFFARRSGGGSGAAAGGRGGRRGGGSVEAPPGIERDRLDSTIGRGGSREWNEPAPTPRPPTAPMPPPRSNDAPRIPGAGADYPPDPGTFDRPLDDKPAPNGYKWVVRTIGGVDYEIIVKGNYDGPPPPQPGTIQDRGDGTARLYPQLPPRDRLPPGTQRPGPMPDPNLTPPPPGHEIGPGGPPGSHERINPGQSVSPLETFQQLRQARLGNRSMNAPAPLLRAISLHSDDAPPAQPVEYLKNAVAINDLYIANYRKKKGDGFDSDEQRKAFFARRSGGGSGGGGGGRKALVDDSSGEVAARGEGPRLNI